jgi:predicted NBD/HSP70 family sugar kinase
MGATHVTVALTDLRGRVRVWETQEHPVRSDPPGTRKVIADLCRKCLAAPAAAGRPLIGIGVAVPSPVDPADPDRLSTIVIPAWQGRLGLDFLSERFGVPLFVDNDANLGALAEHWWGFGGAVDNLAYIKVATGIGSGHVINGEIYRGATGVAGEIGHLSVDPHGGTCVCGLQGCLVTLVGAQALVARAVELASEFPGSVLAGRDCTFHDIESAALASDPLALQVIREAATHLGTAVAGLLNLMNPAVVVLGGGFARLGDLVLEPLRQRVRARTLVSSVAAAEIIASRLGPQSVAIGAATLVLKAALEDSRLFPTVAAGA